MILKRKEKHLSLFKLRLYSASLTGRKDTGSKQTGFTDFAMIKFDKNVCQFKNKLETGKHYSLLATCQLYLKNGTTYERTELVKQSHVELLKN